MSRYVKWAKKEYSLPIRIAASLCAGLIVVGLLPYLIIVSGPNWDRGMGLAGFANGLPNYIIGGLCLVVGMFFGFWSVYDEFERGRGTPLPMLPTQELLTQGPFRYCRNPMTFGTLMAYLGLAIIAGTFAGIGVMLCFGVLLVIYLKCLEEDELAERFGEAYLRYKRQVPFLIPRPPKN